MLNTGSILRVCSLAVLLGSFSTITANASSAIIPKPAGQYGVGLRTMKLTDRSRIDPFASNPEYRSIMISALYPAGSANHCSTLIVDYMPPATAVIEDRYYQQYGLPKGTFEIPKLSLCKEGKQVAGCIQDFPLVLFSPGLENSRLVYSALAQAVASYGYLVMSIDHPYDANVVEYPDGTLVPGANISTESQIDVAVRTRAQDVSFVLDELSSASTVRRLFPSTKGLLNTGKVAMYGHSLGGATAAVAMLNDSRIAGGANLDGSFFGPILNGSLDRPFLIFGHEGHNQSTDASWEAVWPELRGWKIGLELDGAQHGTFSDFPLLVKVLGLDKVLPPEAEALLGTLDGTRVVEIVSKYLVAFFQFVHNGTVSSLLRGPDKAFPEVSVVATGNGSVDQHVLNFEGEVSDWNGWPPPQFAHPQQQTWGCLSQTRNAQVTNEVVTKHGGIAVMQLVTVGSATG